MFPRGLEPTDRALVGSGLGQDWVIIGSGLGDNWVRIEVKEALG